MTPAQLIRAMRKHAGLTQAKLAKLLGYKQASSVANLEGGRRPNASTATIMHIANVCGVCVVYTSATDTDSGSWEILPADFKVPF